MATGVGRSRLAAGLDDMGAIWCLPIVTPGLSFAGTCLFGPGRGGRVSPRPTAVEASETQMCRALQNGSSHVAPAVLGTQAGCGVRTRIEGARDLRRDGALDLTKKMDGRVPAITSAARPASRTPLLRRRSGRPAPMFARGEGGEARAYREECERGHGDRTEGPTRGGRAPGYWLGGSAALRLVDR